MARVPGAPRPAAPPVGPARPFRAAIEPYRSRAAEVFGEGARDLPDFVGVQAPAAAAQPQSPPRRRVNGAWLAARARLARRDPAAWASLDEAARERIVESVLQTEADR